MIHALFRSVRWVLIALVAAMTIVVALQIVLRYFFNNPLSWGEEITRYMFVYAIFLGAAAGVHTNLHVSINVLVRRVDPKWSRAINGVAQAIVGLFLAFLVVYGVLQALGTMNQKSPALGWPIGYAYLAVPLGAALGLVFLVAPKEDVEEEVLA